MLIGKRSAQRLSFLRDCINDFMDVGGVSGKEYPVRISSVIKKISGNIFVRNKAHTGHQRVTRYVIFCSGDGIFNGNAAKIRIAVDFCYR